MSPKPILFCDFDGVLCFDRFWNSLPPEEYAKVQATLFGPGRKLKDVVNDWMRGKYTAEQVIEIVSNQTGISYEKLWDVFVKDCETMTVSGEALQKLNDFRDRYVVILITANMDSFTRFTLPALQLDKYFDHISNSNSEGLFKTDNGGELFLKYIDIYNADIRESIVFDDSANVCKVFSELGGRAYRVTPEQGILYQLAQIQK